MESNLHNYRKSYDKGFIDSSLLPAQPLELFESWFNEVDAEKGDAEVNAMTLTTIGTDGFPKSRVVLLKHFDAAGFVFYSNYTSEKGLALELNNKVCLSFFWPNLERQVILKATTEKVSEMESDTYFKSRPRGSQLGAWASDQSTVLTSRKTIEESLNALSESYKDKPVPRPPHWGGYRCNPISFEFWQGRPNRLHDRILYTSNDLEWTINRLAP